MELWAEGRVEAWLRLETSGLWLHTLHQGQGMSLSRSLGHQISRLSYSGLTGWTPEHQEVLSTMPNYSHTLNAEERMGENSVPLCPPASEDVGQILKNWSSPFLGFPRQAVIFIPQPDPSPLDQGAQLSFDFLLSYSTCAPLVFRLNT